jgi:hypothetical protein
MNVSAHVERSIDFAQYHTFSWDKADALPTGDPRLDNNPFFQDYFQGAVERELGRRGIVRVERDGDLRVHYHANVREAFSVSGVDEEYGTCTADDCQPRVTQYEAGSFVLDIADPSRDKLVWRGWAQTSIDGVIDNQDWLRKHLAEAVEKMMKLFPRTVLATAAGQ